MQLRFILAPGLLGVLKLHITDLSESLKQLVKSFARVHIGRIRAIAHHKLMHGFVTIDAALALLEMIEESFLIIVGSRHTRHAIASEQAPQRLRTVLIKCRAIGASSVSVAVLRSNSSRNARTSRFTCCARRG